MGSLEHCFDINQSLKEIHRVLDSDGKLIIRWRSDKLIGSPLEYFGYNTLKFFNRKTWKYVLNKNNFSVLKFINKKIEGYDSFEYILAKKSKSIRSKQNKINYLSEYKKFYKHTKYYETLCNKIKNKRLIKKSIKLKIQFIKKNKIGLMNIGKSKSINRFFNETSYFLNFIKKFKKEKIKY